MDPFIGEVKMFAGTFAPVGWFMCAGQTLQINQYQALYAVIGIQFGGNGSTTFCLPDFRGRVPVAAGNGTGLTPRTQGNAAGAETVAINTNQMPAHNHVITNTSSTSGLTVAGSVLLKCSNNVGTTADPTNGYMAKAKTMGDMNFVTDSSKLTGNMAVDSLVLTGTVSGNVTVNSACSNTGANQGHENMQPWLAVNFIIAYEGIFPVRP
jgi:microcystin-dependent protein